MQPLGWIHLITTEHMASLPSQVHLSRTLTSYVGDAESNNGLYRVKFQCHSLAFLILDSSEVFIAVIIQVMAFLVLTPCIETGG